MKSFCNYRDDQMEKDCIFSMTHITTNKGAFAIRAFYTQNLWGFIRQGYIVAHPCLLYQHIADYRQHQNSLHRNLSRV